MSEDILSELFYGQIVPWEDGPRDKDTARKLNHEMSELWKYIEQKADADYLRLLEKYLDRRSDMSMMYQCDCFKTGFRIGVQLLLASLIDEEPQ